MNENLRPVRQCSSRALVASASTRGQRGTRGPAHAIYPPRLQRSGSGCLLAIPAWDGGVSPRRPRPRRLLSSAKSSECKNRQIFRSALFSQFQSVGPEVYGDVPDPALQALPPTCFWRRAECRTIRPPRDGATSFFGPERQFACGPRVPWKGKLRRE